MKDHNLKVYLQGVLRDRRGRFVKWGPRVEANSFVLAMVGLLYVQVLGAAAHSIVDTGGISRSIGAYAYNFRATAGAGDALFGVVVGSGTAGVVIADYALQTLIAHGTGAGQLSYAAVTLTAPSTSGSTRRFLINRAMSNLSGAAITVNEVALYAYGGSSLYYLCLDRSLYTIEVADGLTLTMQYTISVTVS